jgi:ATP-dependent DNA helicase PIF1
MVRKQEMDNRWVVPYNPYLLNYFNCHSNFEACGSIKVVKYLFKYIYKGHDRACITVGDATVDDNNGGVDETKQYRDARWVTPPEAFWRIYGFDLSENDPPVMQLQLHLPGMNMVGYHQNQNIGDVLKRQGSEQSMLT